ncbi:MAG: hypothetical protein ACD_56C00148G0003 [uncultured bacterium]|nr:MAG: hypothetical protein ACD_56C00148G0003 [uncultured bacterium]
MPKKIKNILSLSALVFAIGFLGAFFGKSFEKTKLDQKLEKTLGIKSESKSIETAQVTTCIEQAQEEDNSVMFVGCNGIF